MARAKEATQDINLNDPQYFFNRELSWLEFNRRVLHESLDPRTPLLERLKFAAIFCSNLDEFFMVRVSALKEQVQAGITSLTPDGRSPQEQLDAIYHHLRPMVTQAHQHFETVLRQEMHEHGICLLSYVDLSPEQRRYLQDFFEKRIFPVLTPLAVDPGHPFPFISNLSLNLAVGVKDPDTGVELFARVKVPNLLPRFVEFPKDLRQHDGHPVVWTGVPLEQAIAHNLEALFPGMVIQEYYPFRITRDTDFELQEDEADDLLEAIEQEVRQRYLGAVVRMEIHASTPAAMRQTLMEEMDLSEHDVYEIDGLLNLRDLMSFLALPLPELKDKPYTWVIPPRLRHLADPDEFDQPAREDDIFAVMRRRDVIVHHPYESFSASVEQFIRQAAADPQVLTIKMTLYRTSSDSPIVQALINAAENGKQVVALVELKARFDEENNINWARRLEKVGVHVVYGLVGLKTHTKIVLVVRQEEEEVRRYCHIGTGNYNPKTAKLYTDLSLLTCQEEIGADLTDLFNFLTGYSRQRSYRKLLVSPVNMRDRFLALIRREIDHQQEYGTGQIIAKMNSLVDPGMIRALYEASQAGVKIDLIIRGICCLRPGLQGVSENIRVISIVGRYLEHSRIFYFHNNGQEEVYIGSADWMPRNLDRRVEAIAPIEDASIRAELKQILETCLVDNRQAWDLQSDGTYIQRRPKSDADEVSAQNIFMERALKLAGL
ncbi:MAG TPA: polyphosphate kinase 1 [Synechococcales cyanobacterium M55_K2018_004]|nr:polyphosphate kinase 1 [Synechococcales cyanobacterium M55_K2018_004]